MRGACIEKRGDWSWYKGLGLVGWSGVGDRLGRCCYKCGANRTSHPFTDASKHALWTTTIFTAITMLNMCMLAGNYTSEIFSLPGFVGTYFSIDLLHTGELGVLQYCLGNVLWDLFKEVGGTF